jgi:chromosome segregation ATPase
MQRHIPAVVGISLVLALSAAAAQTLQLKKDAPQPLTRDELRACMDNEDSLQQRKRAQEAERAAIARENDEVSRLGRQLAEDARRTDTHDFSKVDGYNDRATAHDARLAALNARVERFNADVEQLNKEGAAHVERCAARPYDVADRDAILKEPKRLSPQARPVEVPPTAPSR